MHAWMDGWMDAQRLWVSDVELMHTFPGCPGKSCDPEMKLESNSWPKLRVAVPLGGLWEEFTRLRDA